NSLRERRINLAGRLAPRLPPRARPAGGAFRGADGQALGDDLAGEPAAALVIRDGEDRTRVAVGQLTALDHAEHILRKLEQPDAVGDGRLRAADTFADLPQAKAELIDQKRVRTRLLHGRKLLARDILDD